MKTNLIITLTIGICVGFIVGAGVKPSINWIGCPSVSNNDNYTPSTGWLPDFQIGLRDDGVVVWSTNFLFSPVTTKK